MPKRAMVWELLKRTVREFQEDNCLHLAAGIAYYALFSLFPLLLGLIAVLGVLLEPREVRERLVLVLSEYLPGSGQLVARIIAEVTSSGRTLGVLAVIGLFWSASAIFGAVRRSINQAWDVPRERPLLKQKLIEFGMIGIVGTLFTISLGTGILLQFLDEVSGDLLTSTLGRQAMLSGIGCIATFLIVLSIYRFLPNTRVLWADVWPSAVIVTVVFEGAKRGFLWYLEAQALRSYSLTYGPLTTVMVFLLWAYLSAIVLLAGAELASEYGRLRRELSRCPLSAPEQQGAGWRTGHRHPTRKDGGLTGGMRSYRLAPSREKVKNFL